MKGMKARISGTAYETEVVPYFPEGMFAGFTDISGSLQPGMIVYKPRDLEFLETPPKLKPKTDWEAFRREAAKDILCAVLGRVERFYTGVTIDGKNKISDHKDFIKLAIEDADELIKQLRDGKE